MRVLIVSCVFPPEPVVSSQTSSQTAEELAIRGHDVAVVAPFPNRPGGRLYKGYSRKILQGEKTENGLDIVRCFSFFSTDSSILSRFLENISFGLTSSMVVLFKKHPDVIYSNTWPLFATGLLHLVAYFRKIPLVLSVQDVYPESLFAQKRFEEESWLIRILRRLDRLITQRSKELIVISESFAKIYRKDRKIPSDRIHVIPNWLDASKLSTNSENPNRFLAQKNIPDDAFLIVYGGNIGMASGIETVIESFEYLEGVGKSPYLLIAGEGSNLGTCREIARKVCAGRIIFHSPWPVDETSEVLASANLLVLPTRSSQSMASVPSKLITYMLMAHPVLALALPGSDIAALIERSGCGWVIEPDSPKLLAQKILEIMELDPNELIKRGRVGRDYARKNLTREANLPRVIEVIEKAAIG